MCSLYSHDNYFIARLILHIVEHYIYVLYDSCVHFIHTIIIALHFQYYTLLSITYMLYMIHVFTLFIR